MDNTIKYDIGGQIQRHKPWNELSLSEKSEMIKVAVMNGITDLPTIKEKYNEFAEGGDTKELWTMEDEAKYREWRNSLPDNLRLTNDNDYDMRGAFKAGMQPTLESDGLYHLGSRDPETGRILKAPHHPTYLQAINTDARMGYYPMVDDKGQTYTQTWEGNLFADGGIHIKPENRGKFTALKERTGHSATWFKEHGTPAQKKMATFALNARKWKHGLGGHLFDDGGEVIDVEGYPLVDSDLEGLTDWFNNNPNVAGMAIGAGLNGIGGERRVVLNPNLKDSNARNSVYMNESYRHFFDANNIALPAVTDVQREAYKGTSYEGLDRRIQETEAARYLSGDPSHHLNTKQKAQLSNFRFTYLGRTLPEVVVEGKKKALGGPLVEDANLYGLGDWLKKGYHGVLQFFGAEDRPYETRGKERYSQYGYIGGTPRETRQKYFNIDQELTDSVNSIAKRHGLNPSVVASRLFADGGIHIAPSKKGTFTAAATKHGMGVQEFASKVLSHPENYSPAMRKKANFARNAAKWHGEGGNLFEDGGFWNTIDSYANGAEKALSIGSLAATGATIAAPNPYTLAAAYATNVGSGIIDGYQGVRAALKGDYGNALKNASELLLSISGAKLLKDAQKLSKLDDALRTSGATREYITRTVGRRAATKHTYKVTKEAAKATDKNAIGFALSTGANASSMGDIPTKAFGGPIVEEANLYGFEDWLKNGYQ